MPYIQRLLVDRASILWTTAQPISGSVTLIAADGSQSSFPATATEYLPATTQLASTYYQYQADVTGLQAATNYQYQVVLDGQIAASDPVQNTFTTPAPGKLAFLVFGDSGADSPEQLSLIQRMALETNIGKVLHVGDLAYNMGTFAQMEANYFALNASLMSRLPFFATPGNHEYLTANAAAFLAGHVAPASNVPTQDLGRYYSYDWGDIHVVSVDSNQLPEDAGPRMLAWLDSDLASTEKYWKIVFLHHPPYPTGTHLGDPICELAQQYVNPIVEKHGVQLVLSGHEHGYERSFPIVANQPVPADTPSTTYVITGGGGQYLETVGALPQCALSVAAFNYVRVDVVESTLTLKAIGLDGTVIDALSLNPPPVIAANGILSAAGFTSTLVAGSAISIFGQNFAVRSEVAANSRAGAATLGGISVTLNQETILLTYVSPTQIHLHVPRGISGQVNLQVTTPNGSASATVTVIPSPVAHTVAVQN